MAKKMKMRAKEIKEKLESDANFRKKIFDLLLEHLRDGYSIDCFSFLSDTTIYQYLKTYKDEFVEEDLIIALREGKEGWEDIGRRQSLGTCLGNSRSWYYNMSARYKWSDRMHIDSETKGTLNVNVIQYSKPTQPTA